MSYERVGSKSNAIGYRCECISRRAANEQERQRYGSRRSHSLSEIDLNKEEVVVMLRSFFFYFAHKTIAEYRMGKFYFFAFLCIHTRHHQKATIILVTIIVIYWHYSLLPLLLLVVYLPVIGTKSQRRLRVRRELVKQSSGATQNIPRASQSEYE